MLTVIHQPNHFFFICDKHNIYVAINNINIKKNKQVISYYVTSKNSLKNSD